MLSEIDQKLLKIAYEEAKEGFEEGGCPIGSVSVSYTHLTLPTKRIV